MESAKRKTWKLIIKKRVCMEKKDDPQTRGLAKLA